MTATPLVVLENVNKHFGELHVLRDINLSVNAGEVVVIIGPSGSGKSTLCRTINRLETIDSGRILVNGQPLPAEGRALARLRSDVGMVFQSFNLFSHMTVLENITLGPTKVLKIPRPKPPCAAWNSWNASASPTRPTSTRPSFPAVSSSGLPSPVPWR